MNQALFIPIAIPAMTAAVLVLLSRYTLSIQRVISVIATLIQLPVALWLYSLAGDGETRVYLLGSWPPPFGIVLVLDRLSATMLLLAAFLSCAVVLAALGIWDQRGRHFHALFQFQLLGIFGAFLTGDLFNLFVFFEVLLIASYGLMLHGGGARRLRAGFHYVAINLVGSTIFLFAIGTIYAVTGTLNMADIAVKVREVAPGNEALLATGGLLLLVVFAIKSAMVPLQWWLPPTYGTTSPPAAALFAIMTKVGAYSIIRMYTLAFGPDAGALAGLATPWILPAAIVTLVFGTIGVVASRTIADLVCYSVVASMGTLLIAVGLNSPDGIAAALYYTAQSTLTSAGLFLLAGLLVRDGHEHIPYALAAPPTQHATTLAGLFFLLAIAMVGMPPLAGFLGKLLILDAGRAAAQTAILWPVILGTSLFLILGFARAGIAIFWASKPPEQDSPHALPFRPVPVGVISALLVALASLSIFAGPVMSDMSATSAQLLDPQLYIRAVLDSVPVTTAMGQ